MQYSLAIAVTSCWRLMESKIGASEKDNTKSVTEPSDPKSEPSKSGEELYIEVKADSLGFSQGSALSPAKRARFEIQATHITR